MRQPPAIIAGSVNATQPITRAGWTEHVVAQKPLSMDGVIARNPISRVLRHFSGHGGRGLEPFRVVDVLRRRETVADGRTKRGPYANDRVNPHEPNELKYWCQKLTCTEMQLKHAVRAVGTSADAVRHFLKGKK